MKTRKTRTTARPISWHKECFNNFSINLAHEEMILVKEQAKIKRWREEVVFYQKQIEEAERQGKTKFDRDKFMKEQKPKLAQ